METAEPLFTRDGAVWRSCAATGGPFGGRHGGAVSGLIVAEMEREAQEQGLGVMLSAAVLFLRPAPKGPLTTRTTLLRKGGRTGALETELIADEKLIAKGIASCVAPRPIEDTFAAPPRPSDPAAMPPWLPLPRFSHPTLFDVLDFRSAGDGTKWGRLLRPLVPYPTTLAPAFTVADNGQPLSLLGHQAVPRYALISTLRCISGVCPRARGSASRRAPIGVRKAWVSPRRRFTTKRDRSAAPARRSC